MKRAQPEAQLQGAVVAFLRAALPARAIVFHCPNGGGRDKREAARLKWQGVLAGIPDVLVILDAHVIGIELKSPKGRLTPEQATIADRFCENECLWTVARSVEEVERFFRQAAFPMRASVLAGERLAA